MRRIRSRRGRELLFPSFFSLAPLPVIVDYEGLTDLVVGREVSRLWVEGGRSILIIPWMSG